MFCPKCGALMTPSKKAGKKLWKCSCGYVTDDPGGSLVELKMINREDKITIIDEQVKFEIYPKTNIECPKCGHNEAYYWFMQTRGGDEPETRFYKCVKCGYTWREYS